MEIKVLKRVAVEIGEAKFKPFGVSKESWGWKEETTIDLKRMDKQKTADLRALFEANRSVRGVGVLLKDMDTWATALSDSGGSKPRSVRQFEPLLIRYLGAVPGHRIYRKVDDMGDVWLAHYVNKVEYHPAVERSGSRSPAYVHMALIYESFGGMKEKSVNFEEADCRGMAVVEALARQGYYPETADLRAKYLKEAARFGVVTKQVGKQYLATGKATDDLDGNPQGRDSSWYWRGTHVITMEKDGTPARVVIDVYRETEEREREDRVHVNAWFWWTKEHSALIDAKDDEDSYHHDDEEEIAESLAEENERPEIEIPLHPFVAIFDLKRHLRMRIHLNYLTEYKYDAGIAEKLILPTEMKELVKMLIEHRGTFQDIIGGKAGGAVVLLTGKPGVGKTLTAEVYAESEGRALYSVQASQLGTDPDVLEDELLKVFTRAARWNAVMLLDEADVYVRQRGGDLQQNAIVGVFLRVLEYQNSVLFLTTNRPDDVDDAIASRCVARLNYLAPGVEDQVRIWKVLTAMSGIEMSEKTMHDIAAQNTKLTGRDVKNLLKLAQMVAASNKQPITPKTIEYVKRFKPTGD